MAFKNDPISTVLDSLKAILTFSILFWSMSILFNSFRGPDPDPDPDWTGPDPDPDPDRIRPSKTVKKDTHGPKQDTKSKYGFYTIQNS
jgi:hypothetical protein